MLEQYRNQIDQIDQQLIELLEARFAVTKQVGDYKREHQVPVLNSDREQQIIDKISALDLQHSNQVTQVYLAMMDISKKQQDE